MARGRPLSFHIQQFSSCCVSVPSRFSPRGSALGKQISAVTLRIHCFPSPDFMVMICPATSVPDESKIHCAFSVSLRFCCCGARSDGCQARHMLGLELEGLPSTLGSLYPSSGLCIHIMSACCLGLHHLF